MAIVVDKTMRMSETDIVRYQLLTYCFTKSLKLSDSEIDCLLLLVRNGECDLSDFSRAASLSKTEKEPALPHTSAIFKTPQTVRNFLTRAEKDNLVVKSTGSRKKIKVNPEMEIQFGTTILLNFKIAYVAPKES